MAERSPHKVYKYQSLAHGSYALENLRNGSIWFSRPSMLNDPFDCAIPLLFSRTDGELEKLIAMLSETAKAQGKLETVNAGEAYYLTNGKPNQKFKDFVDKTIANAMAEKTRQFQNYGVACFSETFDNILMWSHYADGHRGLCLEFDTRYPPFNERQKLHQVKYRNSYPSLSVLYVMENPEMPLDPLITKSLNWKYEKEWRFITEPGDILYQYDPRALSGIYFGCAMDNSLKAQISNMLAKSAAHLYSMRQSDTKFELELIPDKG